MKPVKRNNKSRSEEHDPGDPSRIDKVITILNGLRAADSHLQNAVGEEWSDPDENTPVKLHHVQLIVNALKNKLGSSNAELFPRFSVINQLFRSLTRPWDRVKNPAGLPGNQTAADIQRGNIMGMRPARKGPVSRRLVFIASWYHPRGPPGRCRVLAPPARARAAPGPRSGPATLFHYM